MPLLCSGALIIGRIWFEGFASISTFLGLVSAGIAIALKDLLVNIAGWAYIIGWKPFEVEDRIEIGEHSGDVIDVQLTQFTVMETGNWVEGDQSTGRIIHIPNGLLFSQSLANYSKGFPYIWEELPVLITFESNWEKAKSILNEIAQEQSASITKIAQNDIKRAARRHMIFYNKLTPIVYTSTKDSGVLLTIRFLTELRKRRNRTHNLWEAILTAFSEHNDIDFAYPTTRYYSNPTEGKLANNPPQ